ncbi:PIN domain-containing protein [Sphingomonas sp. UV9]|uniref:type II toxin-antitoxin system VapC family toxin n=1 Tax=Sphingomonas sp. UV9 TaxID=1851410 RepID=UPI000FFB5BFF|nr:type II toxin-antitoxin system VapC family toxin [Sphingomonas sp. UV9]RXD02463.1 PIN domain-containing protein [Sphingomonas sp. UV9]
MIYCDTSLLVALLVEEAHSVVADLWMRERSAGAVFASAWVGTEIAGALALKHRLGQLDDVAHAQATRAAVVLLNSLSSIPIETRHFVDAQRLVSSPPKGLRSGDALHLAIVVDHALGLATFDKQLANAARHNGVGVVDLLLA